MDGLSSVARPTWKPHRRWHGYSPPASFSALGPPPEAWNMRGQVRSPRPQAALEGGWPLSWPPVSLLLLLCPALIPSLPGPAGPHACKASRWMPAGGTGKTDEGQEESSVPSNCPRQGHHESGSGYGAQRHPLRTGLPQKCGASFPLSKSSGCFTWVKHLGSA